MINKEYLEKIYAELKEQAKTVPSNTVDDERVDAKLCLIEEMLDACDKTGYNEIGH